MLPEVGIATDYVDEKVYAAMKGNLYRRLVTVDNTGKTAKSNYLVRIVLDTATIHDENKCSYTFADLRVYDSDGVTPLNFYVDAPNLQWTQVYVRIPDLPATSKIIYLEYGNPGLVNTSSPSSTLGSVFADLTAWFSCTETNHAHVGAKTATGDFPNWRNKAIKTNYAVQFEGNTGGQNFYSANRWGGLQARQYVRLTTPRRVILASTPYSVFIAEERSLNDAKWLVADSGAATTNNRLAIGYSSTTNFRWSQQGNDLNYTVPAFAIDQKRLWSCVLDSSGHTLRLNGSQVASNTNTTAIATANRLRIGTLDASLGSDATNYIGDIIVIAREITSAERSAIEEYMNVKHQIYDTHDFPSITVGGETSIPDSAEFTYKSYAPIGTWSTTVKLSDSKLIHGMAPAAGDASIIPFLGKQIAMGTDAESWDASTQSNQKMILRHCREIEVTDAGTVDTVSIDRTVGEVNRGRLDRYELVNDAESTVYEITPDDFIAFDFLVQDKDNFEFSTSYLRFLKDSSNYYQVDLVKNVNAVTANVASLVMIPISSFIQTGTLIWADVVDMQVRPRTSTGTTQTVNYENFRVVKNIESDEFAYNLPVCTGSWVSEDNRSTWFRQISSVGRLRGQQNANRAVTVDFDDYLTIVRSMKFRDFDSFPDRFAIYYAIGDLSDYSQWYNYYLRKVLGFFLPSSMIDVDLTPLAGDSSVFTTSRFYFLIQQQDTVGEIIDALLAPMLGYLTYDPTLGKFVARSGYKTWDGENIPTPYDLPTSKLISYSTDSGSDDLVYNSIEMSRLEDEVGPSSLNTKTVAWLIDAQYQIPAESTITAFIETNISGSEKIYLLDNAFWHGYNVGTNADSTSYNNTGVSIDSVNIVDDKIAVTVTNTNFSERYLRQIHIQADSHRLFRRAFESEYDNRAIDFLLQDEASIQKHGRKPYIFNQLYSFNDSTYCQLFDAFLKQFAKPSRVHSLKLMKDPNIRFGAVVRFRSSRGRIVTGFVIECTEYANESTFGLDVKLVEIFIDESALIGNFLTFTDGTPMQRAAGVGFLLRAGD